jgi:Leucine-rich repeat (LRR) protein
MINIYRLRKMWEEKYPFITDAAFLIAGVDENGSSYIGMKLFDESGENLIFYDGFYCYTVFTGIKIDSQVNHRFHYSLPKYISIRSSFRIREVISISQRDIDFSLKSWAQGIAELGRNAYRTQSQIDMLVEFERPFLSIISFKLFRFIFTIDPSIFTEALTWLKEEYSVGREQIELPSLIADIRPILNMLITYYNEYEEEFLGEGTLVDTNYDYYLNVIQSENVDRGYEEYYYEDEPEYYILKEGENIISKILSMDLPHEILAEFHEELLDFINHSPKLQKQLNSYISSFYKSQFLPKDELFALNELNKMLSTVLLPQLEKDLCFDIFKSSSSRAYNKRKPCFAIKKNRIIKLSIVGNKVSKLPDSIGYLSGLQELDLMGNYIKEFPNSLSNLKNLTLLNYSKNELEEIPELIAELKTLKFLNLSQNKISTLPNSLTNLKDLKIISLENNELVSSEKNFEILGSLTNLQFLNLKHNELTEIPDGISKLRSLVGLDISWNEIVSITESFGKLQSLEIIHIIDAMLEKLPESFGLLKNVRILSLGGNKIKKLPESFGGLRSLTYLDLEKNSLETLPVSFGNLSNLSSLNIEDNVLKFLPNTFEKMKNLTSLILNENFLQYLPQSFCQLEKLEILEVNLNRIIVLPEKIGNLKNLRILQINQNELTSIPKSICNLESLEELYLSLNHIFHLPREIGKLKRLTRLFLMGNYLEQLPASFSDLISVFKLDLAFNKIKSLPEDIGKMENLAFFDIRKNQLEKLPNSISNILNLIDFAVKGNPIKNLQNYKKSNGSRFDSTFGCWKTQ